ncbi:MAG: hypothetical protein ACREOU_05930, partial [Candidatus Eiseniibacteriota bacterium]
MRRAPIMAFAVFAASFAFAPAPAHAGTIAPSLAREAAAHPDARVRVWVRFTDRAGAERDPAAFAAERSRRSAASLERRRLR